MNYKYPEDNTKLFNNNSNSSNNNNATLDLVQTKRSEYGTNNSTSNNTKNNKNNININDDPQDRDIEKKKNKRDKKKPQRSSRFSLFGKRHQSDGYNSLLIQEEKRFEFGWRELYIQRQQKKKVDQTQRRIISVESIC